jgi:thiol-disulfide isomerase/thioredoxin
MLQLNIQRVVMVVLICQSVLLANAAGPKQTTITCNVPGYSGSAVALYKVEAGAALRIGFRFPGKQDTIRFSFPMEKEGTYYIQRVGKGGMYNHVIYLKPGDDKLVEISPSRLPIDFDCKVVNPNNETVYLQAWNDRLNDLCKLGIDRSKRDEYIIAYDALVKQAAELKRKTPSGNRYFKQLFVKKVDAEISYAKAAAFFLFGERMNSGLDTVAEHRQFYQPLANQDFCTAGLLESEHGLALLKYNLGYQLFQKYGTHEQMAATSFGDKMKMICNDTLKAAFAMDRMEQITNYEQFKTDIQPFKGLFASASLKKAYQQKVDELTVYAKGAKGYNFSLKDTKDQTVSLSDFKGKVVVIDMWAMWCGPCLAEKPVMEKIAEGYHDRNDIVFVGVSVDGLSRRDIWKAFVKKKGFTSIELLSNHTESIQKYYKIEGIPRFLFFDREGKIVTVDAPRPSNPAFKKLIEQTLNNEERVTNR